MSSNKQKYFVVSHVVKANNKTEAAQALGRRKSAPSVLLTSTPAVERISAVEAHEWTA